MWRVTFVTFLGRMWSSRTRKSIFLPCDVFCHILPEKHHILAPPVQNFFEREEMWRFGWDSNIFFSSRHRFVTYLASVKRKVRRPLKELTWISLQSILEELNDSTKSFLPMTQKVTEFKGCLRWARQPWTRWRRYLTRISSKTRPARLHWCSSGRWSDRKYTSDITATSSW